MTMEIRIYVANLRAYNEGRLVGEWIDLPMDEEALQEKLNEISAENDADRLQRIADGDEEGDELAIHDYEAPWKIGEYYGITKINDLAEELEDLADHEQTAFLAILEDIGGGPEEALNVVRDGDYELYEVNSLAELAEQFVDDGLFGEIPDSIARYIDYESIGHDLRIDGYSMVEVEGTRYALRTR